MKDKEKQIEEMANCENCTNYEICYYRKTSLEQGFISFNRHLNKVKEKGCIHYQSKLPEDSVVLTREEYEKGVIERDSMRIQISLLFDERDNARKETAEKIYDKVMSFIGSNQKFWIVDDEHITIIDVDKLFDFVMETAKQFGVEIKE